MGCLRMRIRSLGSQSGGGGGGGKGGKGGKGSGSGNYEEVVKNLILEGLYALCEKKVLVRCRKKDDEVVKKAGKSASEEYKKNMNGREVEVVVDDKERLPEGS